MPERSTRVPDELRADVETLWDYHDLHHEVTAESIGDVDRVITMLVGDTQRIAVYAERGFAVPQDISANVDAAYERLVEAGYTGRLVVSANGR